MIDKNLNKGISEIKKIGLSSHDKKHMLEHLTLYANQNPIHINTSNVIKSPFMKWAVFFHQKNHFAYSVIALILIISMGVGTVTAAESSLPGDLLYLVKIKINEPVRGAFKITPEAKVEWEGKKALKRLEEAQTLAEKGRFDYEKRIKIEEEFEKNKNAFIKKVDEKKEKVEEDIQKDESRSNKKEIKKEEKDSREVRFETDVEDRLKKINEKKKDSGEDQEKEINNLEKNIKEKVDSSKGRRSND